MYFSLQQFKTGIDGLISHIEFEEAREEYFRDGFARYTGSGEFDVDFRFFVANVISRGTTNGKRFLYNSMIVSLYGYLESFIEDIVKEYVSQLSADCEKYLDVPLKVRERHLELSIDLVKGTRRDRNLGKEEKAVALKRIVGNMNSCLNELDDFVLNEDAYSIHTANFRYDSIHNLFQRAGVNGILRLALERDDLRNEVARVHSLAGQIDKKTLISLLTAQLDDLAQRRNEISHGSLNSDLQSLELFKNRAKFIRRLGVAVHDVLKEKADEFLFPIIKKFNLGPPTAVYQGRNVLGYNFVAILSAPAGLQLSVGEEIFSYNENSDRKLIVGKVVALKCNGTDVNEIFFDRSLVFTVQVDFKITSHMRSREIFFRI